jgi:hypothetical protein
MVSKEQVHISYFFCAVAVVMLAFAYKQRAYTKPLITCIALAVCSALLGYAFRIGHVYAHHGMQAFIGVVYIGSVLFEKTDTRHYNSDKTDKTDKPTILEKTNISNKQDKQASNNTLADESKPKQDEESSSTLAEESKVKQDEATQ